MTDAEYIVRLERDNLLLMGLLCMAISKLPEPRRGRQPGEPVDWSYVAERPLRRLLADIDRAGSLRVIDGGAA